MNKGTAIVGFLLCFLAGGMLMYGVDRSGMTAHKEGGHEIAAAQDGSPWSDEEAAVPVSSKDPHWGSRTAPVTIVIFSDFQCPFCTRVETTVNQLKEKYGRDKLRIVWKNNPLPFHKEAKPSAIAAEAVFRLGGSAAFWKFHDSAFAHQKELNAANYETWAAEAGVDRAKFKALIDKPELAAKVDADMAVGKAAGVTGTPASFINGVFLSGAQPIDKFTAIVEEQLVVHDCPAHVAHCAEPRAEGLDGLDGPGLRTEQDDVLMGTREHDAPASLVTHERERHVLIVAEPVSNVVVEHGVEDPHEILGRSVGFVPTEGRDRALHHEHHESRGKAVAGDIADRDPSSVLDGEDVVVVAAHLARGDHLRCDIEPGHVEATRQDRRLDARADLHLLLEPLFGGHLKPGLVDLQGHAVHRFTERAQLDRAFDARARIELAVAERLRERDEFVDGARQPTREHHREKRSRDQRDSCDERHACLHFSGWRERSLEGAQVQHAQFWAFFIGACERCRC